jgi:hypothetical protein
MTIRRRFPATQWSRSEGLEICATRQPFEIQCLMFNVARPRQSSSHFRVADLQTECPGVGVDLIRQLLARLQRKKKVKALGTGRGAKWEKTTN